MGELRQKLTSALIRTRLKDLFRNRHNLHSYARDDRGAIAIMFALSVAIIFGAVAGAVEYGRWLSASSQTIQAMDTAVLAGGRMLQIQGKKPAEAIAVAEQYYERNRSRILSAKDITFRVVNGSEVRATSNAAIATPFLGVLGIPELKITHTARAVLATGGNSGSHIELSMMLDTTGSMQGQKMADLKEAAKDLVNIVVWQDQSTYTSRVALVPFAEYVNVSAGLYAAVTGEDAPMADSYACVKEREGPSRYTDDAPGTAGGHFGGYAGSSSCKPSVPIVPLTSDKDALTTAIDALPATGRTAGHLGTAWAWYLLSPKFNPVLPSQNQARTYGLLSERNNDGAPKLHKIAVLMTDGEYNIRYSGDQPATQARAICNAMKEKGIVIYTVGFQIAGGAADETMQLCATSHSHYYSANDGVALKAAFRDIAIKISTLRLAE